MTKYMFALSMLLSAGAMHGAASELNKESVAIAIQSTVTQSDKKPEKNITALETPSLAEIAEKTTPAAPMTPEENECFYYGGIPSPYKHNQRSPDQFKRCMDFKKSEKELAKAKESATPSWKDLFFSRCVASYITKSHTGNEYFPFNEWPHTKIPCDKALGHMQLLKRATHNPWIEGLRICTSRTSTDSGTSALEQCTELNQAATLSTVIELLKWEMGNQQ